jgi:hypothetical protein
MRGSKLVILKVRESISYLIVDTRDMEHLKVEASTEDTVSNQNQYPVECR